MFSYFFGSCTRTVRTRFDFANFLMEQVFSLSKLI